MLLYVKKSIFHQFFIVMKQITLLLISKFMEISGL